MGPKSAKSDVKNCVCNAPSISLNLDPRLSSLAKGGKGERDSLGSRLDFTLSFG